MQRIFAVSLLFLGCCLGVLSPPNAATAQQSISIQQAQALLQHLVQEGQLKDARDLTKALLEATPDNLFLLLSLAKIEKAMGNHQGVIAPAKKAHHIASKKPEKFYAAMSVAEAHAELGRFTASQLWLRRAQQHAPSKALKNKAIRDFRFVRVNNPLSFDLRFSVRPSDNVNNGTTSKGFYRTVFGQELFFATPTSSKPLHGTEISYGATATWRPHWSEKRPIAFSLDFDARNVVLGSDAKDVDPDVDASKFTFQQLTLGATYDVLKAQRTEVTAGLSFGRNWYGSEHLTDVTRATLSASHVIGRGNIAGVNLRYSDQIRQDSGARSSTGVTVSAYYSWLLPNNGRITLNGSYGSTDADSADYAYDQKSVRVSFTPANPILGASARFSVGYSSKDFARPLYIASPRSDQTVSLDASFAFNAISYFGFAPVVSLSTRSTTSNVARFKTEEIGISLGLKSAF